MEKQNRKNKNKLIFLIIGIIMLIAIGVTLFVLVNSPKNKIIGTWVVEDNSMTMTFTKDGKLILESSKDTKVIDYSIQDKDTIINNYGNPFKFYIRGDFLYITIPNLQTFKLQKIK